MINNLQSQSRKELIKIIEIQQEEYKKLESYIKKMQADRINDIAKERKRWAKEDLKALKEEGE
jgi:ribosome recycling factor